MWQHPNIEKYWAATERIVETVVFACRWLLAPFYVGLALSIVILLIKFLEELFHLAAHAFTSTESQVILGVLSLVDMALTGSLLIIVIFSGYENFVSRIDHSDHKDWPQWMGTIDFSALKLKLLSSIVAISAIQLLKQFMAVNNASDRDLYFLIAIHVVFVVSSVLLALADRIAGHEPAGHAPHGGPAHAPAAPSSDGEPSHRGPHLLPSQRPHSTGEIMVAAADIPREAHVAAKPATSPKPPTTAAATKPAEPGSKDKKGPK
jgi:uncharacterized protein (TIGR00645 family)